MNLFITSKSPVKSAKYLLKDKIRLNKQILECNQILATALHLNGADEKFMPYKKNGNRYKPTHIHHPICKWVAKSLDNFMWTLEFMNELCKLNPKHCCKSNIPLLSFAGNCFMKSNGFNGFLNCTPYKDLPVFVAYKKHLEDKWKSKNTK